MTVAAALVNAFTVDVEDYFHVSAFERVVARDRWDGFESRVEANTDRLIRMLADARVRGTFFVLGWVAERHAGLVRRIAEAGHEIGAHSYEHRLVYRMTPAEFREDLRRVRGLIEEATGRPVVGYRAPSFSIVERSRWAYDILAAEGFRYSASVFPIHHDVYGMPGAPRHPHAVTPTGDQYVGRGFSPAGSSPASSPADAPPDSSPPSPRAIWEFPSSTVRLFGQNLPAGGGGYLRIFPYAYTSWAIRRLNRVDRLPAMVYLHPWEVDPGQPRIAASLKSRLRHYTNLGRMEARVRRLLRDFRFDTVSGVLFGDGGRAGVAGLAG